MKSIAIFCGASSSSDQQVKEAIAIISKDFAQNQVDLIYGGAGIGIMGEVATTMVNLGLRVIGVIPQQLMKKEIAHGGLDQLYVVKDMHERKKKMYDLSDGFLILPGGMGTMDEFFEILTWKQLGLHSKPIAILNINGYYDDLLSFMNKAIDHGLVKHKDRELFYSSSEWKETWSYLKGKSS